MITRFPAQDLLVAGKTYVRGIDLVDGKVIPSGNGDGDARTTPKLAGTAPE